MFAIGKLKNFEEYDRMVGKKLMAVSERVTTAKAFLLTVVLLLGYLGGCRLVKVLLPASPASYRLVVGGILFVAWLWFALTWFYNCVDTAQDYMSEHQNQTMVIVFLFFGVIVGCVSAWPQGCLYVAGRVVEFLGLFFSVTDTVVRYCIL